MVEPKDYNTSRSVCHAVFFILTIIVGGKAVDFTSRCDCPHEPKCLPRRLAVSAVEETLSPAAAAALGLDQANTDVVDEFDDGSIDDADLLALGS